LQTTTQKEKEERAENNNS